MKNEDILNRIELWMGYGSLEAPVWFVGMEEGLAGTEESELEERFRVTAGKITMDIRRGTETIPLHRYALDVKQQLWNYQIALYLYLKYRRESTPEERRAYRAHSFGDIDLKETACLDLMPLPSQDASESTWLYAKYGIEGLESREKYLETYKQRRIRLFKEHIEQHKPKLKLVVFCGTSHQEGIDYKQCWTDIIGKAPELIIKTGLTPKS